MTHGWDVCTAAGAALHGHLSHVMPPLLQLASQAGGEGESPKVAAAVKALRRVVLSVQEEGAYLLVAELTKARPAALPRSRPPITCSLLDLLPHCFGF